jgi:hypothetical protein
VLLGFDEIGILTDIFAPEFNIPILEKTKKIKDQVFKYLHDNLLLSEDIENLEANKAWKKR